MTVLVEGAQVSGEPAGPLGEEPFGLLGGVSADAGVVLVLLSVMVVVKVVVMSEVMVVVVSWDTASTPVGPATRAVELLTGYFCCGA